ncbi:phosphate-induced protein 1 conserved region-domain-containing protein [Jimgerdemannia flammicorona]|uniref:Phosphate-induced protein 1 conserved region-domain-containing protein n=1 Tax=Jimgerdemannia flammicorona TaxID=994334 RepID=A0A433D526_9FUNG|nr:phosphate-induced protein 1 conserved region-domain-containing protein [Jimgerdemannia flammicorona]
MRFSFYTLTVLACIVASGVQAAPSTLNERDNTSTVYGGITSGFPTDGQGPRNENLLSSGDATVQLHYFGGKVMWHHINIYYILYGNRWTSKSQEDLLVYYGNHISNTAWWKLVALPDKQGHKAGTGGVSVKKVIHCSGSCMKHSSKITRPTVVQIVSDHLSAGKVPLDVNAIYIVLTSPDVIMTSSCSGGSCGFHDHATYKGTPIVYSWVGNWYGTGCTIGCIDSHNSKNSPNGDVGIDGLISVLSHELAEAATNPYYDAWQGKPNAEDENGDLCSWK